MEKIPSFEKPQKNEVYNRLETSDLDEDTISQLKKLAIDPNNFLECFNTYIEDCEKNGEQVCENPQSVYRKISFYFNNVMKNKSPRKVVELARILNNIFGIKNKKTIPDKKIESQEPTSLESQNKSVEKINIPKKAGFHMEKTLTPERDDD